MIARRLTLAWFCLAAVWVVNAGVAQAVGPPLVSEQWVTNVAADSATLHAQINPNEQATEYRFEYGTSISYDASVPQSGDEVGSGTSEIGVSVHIQGLAPSTVYHYRAVTVNASGTESGADMTFTTQPPGEDLVLPDDRQWELVTPPDKHGALIEAGNKEGGLIQAAASGDGIVYIASGPVTAEPLGSRSPEPVEALSKRDAEGGWTTQDIATPNTESSNVSIGKGNEYRMFSSDLSRSVLEPRIVENGPLSPEATEWTPYLHEEATGLYRPLVTASNVPPGTKFGGAETGEVQFDAASPDLSSVVLSSKAPLTEAAVTDGLYEWSNGRLQLVSILPPPANIPVAGVPGGERNERNTVSADGSLVVWSTPGNLYVRDTTLAQTVQLNVQEPGAAGSEESGVGGAGYQTASIDGSKVFFRNGERLTPGADVGDLYQCEVRIVAAQLTCVLSDISSGVSVDFVIGASEDGSHVYFTHGEEIYLAHDGKVSLVSHSGPFDHELRAVTAMVSPSGRYLAFTSSRSLTGYDNRDAVSGQPDTEVYLYDSTTGRVSCVSCDPTGARPVGLDTGQGGTLVNRTESFPSNTWLSGSVPGWTPFELADALYPPRYLSDSGRVFFDSSEDLVPQDVNGLEDVYEYEPEGVGGCGDGEGCVSLISSGSSLEESVFLDASETGDDVFFMTSEPLAAQDHDQALDIYDAHACSTAVPCASTAATPPPCTTADSCRAAVSPQPAIFGDPSSATFSGSGNVVVAASATSSLKHKATKGKKKPKPKKAKHKKKLGKKRKAKKSVKKGAVAHSRGSVKRRGA